MKYMKENVNIDDISIISHYRFLWLMKAPQKKQNRAVWNTFSCLHFFPQSSRLSDNTVLSCFTLSWPAVLNEYINTDE